MKQLCTFQLGSLRMGIDVTCVQEIVKETPITPIPWAPQGVLGLLNLRGQLVTAIDLFHFLAIKRVQIGSHQIVMKDKETPISLVVDVVHEMVDVSQHPFEPAPDAVPEKIKRLLPGAYRLDDSLIHFLNYEHLTQQLESIESGRA